MEKFKQSFSTRSLTPLEFPTTTKKLLNCNFDTFLLSLLKVHVKITVFYSFFIVLFVLYWPVDLSLIVKAWLVKPF